MTLQLFPPTRQAGLDRLAAFVPRAGRAYAATRNFDLGPDDRSNISLLSPYVRHRLITEQEIIDAVLQQHSAAAAEKFIQEVVWRTYWKGWLEQRPQVWDRYLDDLAVLRQDTSADLQMRLDAATDGETGIACFDAWARELVETGYLHNHARMWFASIWIFTLQLPWQLGADLFLRHLLDGDAASNTLSWRWVAGLQTVGKTYLARADNIATYTKGRFADDMDLARTALPVPPDEPGSRTPLASLPAMPPAPIDVLLVTDDDLAIETWPMAWASVKRVLVLDTAECYPNTAAPVVQFKRAALANTAARLQSRLSPASHVDIMHPADAISLLTTTARASRVGLYDVPVGPTRAASALLFNAIEANGHDLCRLRRPWDTAFWPHATAGFFKVKDKIPKVLDGLNR